MSFTEAIKTCFRKYIDFSGRASRSEYWWFILFTVIGPDRDRIHPRRGLYRQLGVIVALLVGDGAAAARHQPDGMVDPVAHWRRGSRNSRRHNSGDHRLFAPRGRDRNLGADHRIPRLAGVLDATQRPRPQPLRRRPLSAARDGRLRPHPQRSPPAAANGHLRRIRSRPAPIHPQRPAVLPAVRRRTGVGRRAGLHHLRRRILGGGFRCRRGMGQHSTSSG